jgi:hypothetical protein
LAFCLTPARSCAAQETDEHVDSQKYRQALTRALTDADKKVRRRAAIALVECGAADAAVIDVLRAGISEPWVPAYYYPYPDGPYVMQSALVRIGERAVPALVEVLRDEQNPGRGLAIDALGEIGPPARTALPALTAALAAKECPYRISLLESKYLIDCDAASALAGLVPLLDTPEGRNCGGANRVIGRMGPAAKAALPALIAAMHKYKESEIIYDLCELAPHFKDEVVAALRVAARDPELSSAATAALADLGIAAEGSKPPQ